MAALDRGGAPAGARGYAPWPYGGHGGGSQGCGRVSGAGPLTVPGASTGRGFPVWHPPFTHLEGFFSGPPPPVGSHPGGVAREAGVRRPGVRAPVPTQGLIKKGVGGGQTGRPSTIGRHRSTPSLLELRASPSSLSAQGVPIPIALALAVPPSRARRLWPPRSRQQWRRPRRWLPQVRGAPRRRRVGRQRRLRPSRAALRRGLRGWARRHKVRAPPRQRARLRPTRGLAGRRRRYMPRRPAPPRQVARPWRRPGARQPAGRARPTPRPRAGSPRRRGVKQRNCRLPPAGPSRRRGRRRPPACRGRRRGRLGRTRPGPARRRRACRCRAAGRALPRRRRRRRARRGMIPSSRSPRRRCPA